MVSDNYPNEMLSIASRRDGVRVVVELTGELDLHGSEQLAAAVHRVLESPVELVELDATHLTFADSAGLRAVLQARVDAESNGATLRISAVSPPVGRVIEIAGLSDLLLAAPEPG
jgi:anti-sigma B factor antagonist/stage II sporulation protein AA (anti-sigma F factor antagonist)